MVKVSRVWLVLAIICSLICCWWLGARMVNSVQFDHQCEAYLKRAADANTVEIAKENLAKAIGYAEENNLTEGIVSIFFHNPRNDIGFWYENMKACYEELEGLPEDATSLERTNMLMKLRESLVDTGESTSVTVPNGISVYPNNVMYFWWGIISSILACAFWIAFMATCDYY